MLDTHKPPEKKDNQSPPKKQGAKKGFNPFNFEDKPPSPKKKEAEKTFNPFAFGDLE